MIEIKYKKLHEMATIPKSWSNHAVGADIHACIPTDAPGGRTTALLPAGAIRAVHTFIAVEAPTDHFLAICSRSGLASKGIFVANAPGIVDPDYRGEILILLYNSGYDSYYIKHGDRIAQMVAMPAISISGIEVPELSESYRGAQGFGSTGT
jgi:dUTP pyrophosphatase